MNDLGDVASGSNLLSQSIVAVIAEQTGKGRLIDCSTSVLATLIEPGTLSWGLRKASGN